GAPIIGLSAVTGLPLFELSASIGKMVAVLALAPPWILIYLVSGKRGVKTGWPLALVGSLGFIAGQLPTSQFLGPYLPDVVGSLVCFAALLVLLRFWRPKPTLGFGGVELTDDQVEAELASRSSEGPDDPAVSTGSARRALLRFGILVVVVVAWTGPWSGLTDWVPFEPAVQAMSSLSGEVQAISFEFAPLVAGTAILASWLLITDYLRPPRSALQRVFRVAGKQMWGALLVGPLIFGLAQVFNYSGMADSMANGFAKVGVVFVVLAPILGWIAVALSGSNTTANAVFGQFQLSVAHLVGAPALLFPSLNSLGAEVGKPVAPQTASVGVSTTKLVRNEGEVIRYNLVWTLIILAYLVVIGLLFSFAFPGTMNL